MVNFIIPGFYENYNLNVMTLDLLQKQKNWFYDGVNISCIYGTFPFWIWDGGRIFNTYSHADQDQINKIIHTFNDDYKVPLRLICTNPIVQEENYYNRFANLCLELCNNGMNEITVNNTGLEEYIRTNYDTFKYVSSTTKCISNSELFFEEIKNDKYFMICLDYNLNHNWKILDNLPEEYKKKCEFLCNAICPPACPNRKDHYNLNGYFSLSYGKVYSTPGCGISNSTISVSTRNFKNNITNEELYNVYVPKGFEYFKIEGRTLPLYEVAMNYAYYMIKPEYRDMYLYEVMSFYFDNYTNENKMKLQQF